MGDFWKCQTFAAFPAEPGDLPWWVRHTADPQTQAAIQLVAWATLGGFKPTGDDFAMLRLVLLALLPQIGGILLMVGRSSNQGLTTLGTRGLQG